MKLIPIYIRNGSGEFEKRMDRDEYAIKIKRREEKDVET